MKSFWKEARQRAYGAIDLGIEFATLGGYGLEQIEEPASLRRGFIPPTPETEAVSLSLRRAS